MVGSKASKKNRVPETISIKVNGKTVQQSESEKLLGVVMSDDLTWKKHLHGNGETKGLIQQLSQRVGMLWKCFWIR